MTYTAYNDVEIDQKIQTDLDYIASEIVELLGEHADVILLYGGFGRGEGGVVVENGDVRIVNDYDIFIISSKRTKLGYLRLYRKYNKSLNKLAVRLAKELSIKQIDLGFKPYWYFCDADAVRVENYEVKQGNVLLYGKSNPTKLMPEWRASDLPLFDGAWLFRNRGVGMLLAALYFIKNGEIPENKIEYFIIECTKAQLAMGDSTLLLKGEYSCSYQERLNIAHSLSESAIPVAGLNLKTNYIEALNQKLKPNFSQYEERDLVKWWFDIAEAMDAFYKYYEAKRIDSAFASWDHYSLADREESSFEYKAFVSRMIRKDSSLFSIQAITTNIKRSRKSYSMSLVPLALFSLKKDGFDRRLLDSLSDFLDIELGPDDKENWINCAVGVLDEIHPGGEAANVIGMHKQ